MMDRRSKQQKMRTSTSNGYTLIELLLYVALSGMVLTSLVYFFGTITEARVKNQAVSEVNEQGTALMERLTQTVRNATAITTPAVGAESSSLTLTVPTGSLSPTIFDASGTLLGYSGNGDGSDTGQSNKMNATKFVAGATGTVSALYGFVGTPISASPNNLGSMAIYSGVASPTTLLASSTPTPLSPNTWTAFSIPPVNVTSGQTYWLAYNTNGSANADNNLRWHAGTSGQTISTARTFASGWPASWTGIATSNEMAVHAPIISAASAQVRIKEGVGSAIPLTNDNVRVYGLNFKNLTRSGSSGVVQIRFTMARYNPQNRQEYDYRRTFTGTAEMQW